MIKFLSTLLVALLALAGCTSTQLADLGVRIAPTAAQVLPGWCDAGAALWVRYERYEAGVPIRYSGPARAAYSVAKPICDKVRANPRAIVDAAVALQRVQAAYTALDTALDAVRPTP